MKSIKSVSKDKSENYLYETTAMIRDVFSGYDREIFLND